MGLLAPRKNAGASRSPAGSQGRRQAPTDQAPPTIPRPAEQEPTKSCLVASFACVASVHWSKTAIRGKKKQEARQWCHHLEAPIPRATR